MLCMGSTRESHDITKTFYPWTQNHDQVKLKTQTDVTQSTVSNINNDKKRGQIEVANLHKLREETDDGHDAKQDTDPVDLLPLRVHVTDGEGLQMHRI